MMKERWQSYRFKNLKMSIHCTIVLYCVIILGLNTSKGGVATNNNLFLMQISTCIHAFIHA